MADQENSEEVPVVKSDEHTEETVADAPPEEQQQNESSEQPHVENAQETTEKQTDEQTEDKTTDDKPTEDKPVEEPAQENTDSPQNKSDGEHQQEQGGETKDDGEAPQEEGAATSEDVKDEQEQKTEGEEEAKEAVEVEGGPAEELEKKDEGVGQEEETKPEGDEAKTDEQKSASPVPQSDTFAEGERPESPIGVGEKLSREGTPTQEDLKLPPDVLEPGTPDRSRPEDAESVVQSYSGDFEDATAKPVHIASEAGEEHDVFPEEKEEMEEVEEEEEEEEDSGFDREALLEKKQAALAEKEKLLAQNAQLQHKLAEYFRRKKADENRQDYDKNTNDQDSKYVKFMAQLDELHRQDGNLRYEYDQQIKFLEEKCQQKKKSVDEEYKVFMEFKKKVALNSVSNRSGKPIPPKDIDLYLSNEKKKETEVVNVRLENIKLKNKLKKKEQQLKSKEELAENLHLIDFEQLKIENQTYNEKIEERNEELLKLRKKITSTVQVLTHLKEKLQFVQAENQVQTTKLREVEAEVAMKRDVLSRTKQARDALRIDNQRLRQNCGLLGNEPLLRDFEERKDEGEDLRQKLENLKMQHAELTLNCNQVRRKIEQARATHG